MLNSKVNFGIILVIFISVSIHNGDCCNGYKFYLRRITNCNGSDAVIIADQNITASINKKCEITTNGCMTSLGFKTANVKYHIEKNGVKLMDGTKDVCKEMDSASDELKAVFRLLSFPEYCPVEASRLCSDDNKKISLSKYKNMLGMAKGKILTKLFFDFDGGRTACLEIDVEIAK